MTTRKRNMVINELTNMGFKVEIKSIVKNGILKEGIMIDNNGINPMFYLENYEGTAKEIAKTISELFNSCSNKDVDVNSITDFDKAKDNIVMCIRDSSVKDGAVTKQFCDLSIYFRVLIDINDDDASAIITKELLSEYNITEDELFDIAINNMKGKYMFATMIEMLMGLTGVSVDDIITGEDMYVCTTDNNNYGASVMTDISTLDKVADILDDDIYILPSSIHEVIIVRKSSASYEELSTMIKEINETEVSPEERLSDHPYLYSRKLKTVTY